ncbi:MAG: PAS-domain containing protein [Sneathiella sp.]|nr:PAS-domain containing protein [Sneathiella sp.]
MSALPKKNEASVSLLLLSDDPKVVEFVQNELNEPAITPLTKFTSDFDLSGFAPQSAEITILYVSGSGFPKALRALRLARAKDTSLNIVVIDANATPDRAVDMMKAGASDYRSHMGSNQNLLSKIEQSCLDTLLSHQNSDYENSNFARIQGPQALKTRVRKFLKALGYLAACHNLKEVCTGLLETLGDALGATGGSLYLVDGNNLKRIHALDPGHAPESLALPLDKGTIFEKALSTGEPILLTNEDDIHSTIMSGWTGYEASNLLVYPLLQKNGDPIGVFSLHGKKGEHFTKEDRDLVLILASFSHETIRAHWAQGKSVESLDTLRLTFENMVQGIILLNSSAEIVHYNQNVLKIVGLSEPQIGIGTHISEIYKICEDRGDDADSRGDGCPWVDDSKNHEYVQKCVSGKSINVVRNAIEEGGYVLTFTDITKQKEWEVQLYDAKEKAEAASLSKSNFLANVSHELRTPLNAIIGFSEMINKEVFGGLDNTRYVEYVKHIHDSGSHLLRLINNLLDLSKVEAGKFVRQDGEVDLSELVKNTMTYFSGQAQDSGVMFTLKDRAKFSTIWADENALRQILLNLISNAIKFTPRGGEVSVLLSHTNNEEIKITVQDNGIGMEAKSIEIALQPFGQIENAFNRKYPGTGLGLPLVSSLTELHDGRFELQSSLGDGTCCQVYIPLKKAQ